MFGISELLEQDKLKAQKGEDSKFRQLRSIAIDENVLFYLKDRLQNLYIEVLEKPRSQPLSFSKMKIILKEEC